MKARFHIAGLILILTINSSAFAWNSIGHQIVARIAWEKLSPARRQQLSAILRQHPRYAADLESGIQADTPDHNMRVFVRAATWPDIVRSPARGESRDHHPKWHYINEPISPPNFEVRNSTDTDLADPANGADPKNCVQAMRVSLQELKNGSGAEQAKALCWVMHITGDIHQPLHCAELFGRDFPQGDLGGNAIRIKGDPKATLHSLWDDILGTKDDVAAIDNGALADLKQIERDEIEAAKDLDLNHWVSDSVQLAQKNAYEGIEIDAKGELLTNIDPKSVQPGDAYLTRATNLAEHQIVLAGLRLAAILDAAEEPAHEATPMHAASRLPTAKHHFDHVLIIVLENQDQEVAVKDPYLAELATKGAHFTDFHGLFHPSYSNYLAMVSGHSFKTEHDVQINVPDRTIADSLADKKLTWKNYAEGYPGHCFGGDFSGRYARKHVPFASFIRVQREQCDDIVSETQFEKDAAKHDLPNYAFYSPNLDHDGHDTGLTGGTKWLHDFLNPLLADQNFMRSMLVVVTYDESGHSGPGELNHIFTVLLGDMVKPGEYGNNYNHFNLLRTIEDNFGVLPLSDGDGGAKPIAEIWRD